MGSAQLIWKGTHIPWSILIDQLRLSFIFSFYFVNTHASNTHDIPRSLQHYL